MFIFGKFGAPAMGVVGAALATLIARIVEMTALLLVVYLKKSPIACRPRELFGYSASFVKEILRNGLPVIANEFIWGLGVTMYSLAYGRMGDNAVAAITVATTIQDIMSVLFQGLSAATAVILGNELGAGHLKKAERYAKKLPDTPVYCYGYHGFYLCGSPVADYRSLPSGRRSGPGCQSLSDCLLAVYAV